jgi:hypothetical protein
MLNFLINAPYLSNCLSLNLILGAEMPTAATIYEFLSNIGLATQRIPSAYSSSSLANPSD